MSEFIIKSDEKVSEAKYSIWVGFDDEPIHNIHNNMFYLCSGTVLLVPDDENKCWFDFHFYHSPDWQQIIKLRIDASAYLFCEDELLKFAKMIAYLINQYIAKHN
jgi:hypothetical protein